MQPRRATERARKIKPRSGVCVCDLKPAIQSTTSPWSAVNLKKIAEIDKVQLEPAIWSRDTGQWIPCFGRCQLTITLMSNIKDVCCKLASVKWSIASSMSLKHEPVIWLRELVTLAYMKGRTYVSTDVHDVMAIKPNFLTSMGYHIFLTMVLRASAPCAQLRY